MVVLCTFINVHDNLYNVFIHRIIAVSYTHLRAHETL